MKLLSLKSRILTEEALVNKSRFLVLIPISPLSVGAEFPPRTSLPLHCTVMPWFPWESEHGLVQLSNELMIRASAIDSDAIELVSEKAALFGYKNNVPCHVLRQSDGLNLLHTKLLCFLARHGNLPKDEWIVGAGYRAHVTTRNGESFPVGSTQVAKRLVLVEQTPAGIKVVHSEYEIGAIPF